MSALLAPDADISEPIGTITIECNSASIKKEFTFLDSWLAGLISGFGVALCGSTARVDLIEEPDPVLMTLVGPELELKYQSRAVRFPSAQAFEVELHEASNSFLDQCGPEARTTHGDFFAEIARFTRATPT